MANSIARFPKSLAVMRLAIITRSVELGFMAAGVTVAAIAAFQSVVAVLNFFALRG